MGINWDSKWGCRGTKSICEICLAVRIAPRQSCFPVRGKMRRMENYNIIMDYTYFRSFSGAVSSAVAFTLVEMRG
jgi:hypothetical protein